MATNQQTSETKTVPETTPSTGAPRPETKTEEECVECGVTMDHWWEDEGEAYCADCYEGECEGCHWDDCRGCHEEDEDEEE